ncbi:MAG: hypothetical protein M3O80_07490, partial [Chloroflexota bacterium]|nr:hypothetical protein [Chloroflexota bacterium]
GRAMRHTMLASASFVVALALCVAAALILPTTASVVFGVLVLSFGAVGAILASRRPKHRIGWLFCSFAVTYALSVFADAFAKAGLAAGSDWPAASFAAWLSAWLWLVYVSMLEFAFLLFPTGRLLGPRWQSVARTIIAANAVVAFALAIRPGPLEMRPIDNPFGFAPLVSFTGLIDASTALFFLGALLSFGSPFARLPRTSGVEREQIKWVGSAGVLLILSLILSGFASRFGLEPSIAEFLSNACYAVGVAAVPVAMGVAILRYRLYDIDVLINRTLVYGVTTGGIAAAFFGGIVVLQTLLRPFTSGSEIAVAASTLLTVALFQPLRSRVQQAVDRRFYRSRYDAGRTIDAFAEELRDEVDLEAVRAHLLATVGQTMSPAHASLWLRERAR